MKSFSRKFLWTLKMVLPRITFPLTVGLVLCALVVVVSIKDVRGSVSFPWIISALITVPLFLAVTFNVFRFFTSYQQSGLELVRKEVRDVGRSLVESRPASQGIDKKKEEFLNISNVSFHFADKDAIKDFYNDYFKEPTILQIVSERTGEITGGARAGIPQAFEAEVTSKDLRKLISTMKLPDISLAEMFRRYQRETIRNGQVTLGLELVDIDLSDLKSFDGLIGRLTSEYEFRLENADIEKKRALLRKKAAEKTILRLENATGFVLVEGKFTLSDLPEGLYKCTYEHPVSEYLTGEGRQITISAAFPRDRIEPSVSGNYAQSMGKSIPLRVYGKVWQPVDRKGDVWELQISPIAVY